MANQADVLIRTPEVDRTGRPTAEFVQDTPAERVMQAVDANSPEGRTALARANVEQALGGEVVADAPEPVVAQAVAPEVMIDSTAFPAIVTRGTTLEQLRVSEVARAHLN